MLVLLAACAPPLPTERGHCEGGDLGALDHEAFDGAIPTDAVSAEGPAGRSCTGSHGHRWTLARTVEIQGIPCEEAITTGDDRPTVARCTLARDTCVDGLPLRAGKEVRWYPELGRLESGTLAKPATIAGVSCEAQAFEVPSPGDPGYCRVGPDAAVDGFPCAGLARFDADGRLRYCRLREGETAPVAPARRPPSAADVDLVCTGTLSFEQGVLEGCTLATPATLAGLRVPSGASVHWVDGALRLQLARVNERVELAGCAWPHFTWSTGSVAICERTTPTTVYGLAVPVGSRVDTDPWGHVTSVDFAGSLLVEGVPCTGEVAFWPTGRLASCRLATDYTGATGEIGRTRQWVRRGEDGAERIGR